MDDSPSPHPLDDSTRAPVPPELMQKRETINTRGQSGEPSQLGELPIRIAFPYLFHGVYRQRLLHHLKVLLVAQLRRVPIRSTARCTLCQGQRRQNSIGRFNLLSVFTFHSSVQSQVVVYPPPPVSLSLSTHPLLRGTGSFGELIVSCVGATDCGGDKEALP